MAKRFAAAFMLFAFVLTTLSACVVKHRIPPGQIKKHDNHGHQKKRGH